MPCIEPRCHRQTKPKRGRGRKPIRCEPHRQAARRESQRAYAARKTARHTGGANAEVSEHPQAHNRQTLQVQQAHQDAHHARPPSPPLPRVPPLPPLPSRLTNDGSGPIQKGRRKERTSSGLPPRRNRKHQAASPGKDKPRALRRRPIRRAQLPQPSYATATTQTTTKACAQPCSTGALTAIHQRRRPIWSGGIRTVSTPRW